MEGKRRKETKGIEENTLAILDTSGFGKKEISVAQHVQNLNDDRLAFLEAVRTASIVPENGTAPTSKMYQAIFQILREESSLDSNMSSYQLLNELDTLSRTMLLLQYLVHVLEGDFLPRNRAYKEKMNWSLLRDSFLNRILGSRRVSGKALIKDCISVMCMCHVYCGTADDLLCFKNSSEDRLKNCSSAATIALPEIEKCLCTAMQKLLLMIMDLDASKETADIQGLTTRADGPRTPVPEIILDELSYNRDMLSPFLQAFHEPRWKLEIVMQYIRKYVAKPSSVRTRRSKGSTNDATFPDILKTFENGSSTKSILKKISVEVAQLLLAHAFRLYIMHRFANKLSRTASSLVGNFYGSASFRTKKCFTCSSRPVDCQTFRKHAIPGGFVKWGLLGSCRNSSFATGFTPLKAKSLGSIIDIGRAEYQSPEDLAAIWDDYHLGRGHIGASMKANLYHLLEQRVADCRYFVMPLRKGSGYTTMFAQVQMPYMIFTGLEDYKARGTQASPYFTVSYYTEFAETKDLVLIRGDVVFASKLTDAEAKWLLETTQTFYLNDKRYKLIERFNKETREFEFKDVLQALDIPSL